MISAMPRLSILAVVLNDRAGLQRTLASVCNQTFEDWELIIKDGASTDGTKELAQAAVGRDSRMRLMHGADANLYDAMNIALAASRGQWILMLNAGDWLAEPTSLETAFACMESIHPPADIGYFGTQIRLAGGQGFLRRARHPKTIRYGQPAIHQSLLINADWHRRYRYDHQNYPNIADYAAVACMVRDGAVARAFDATLSVFELDEGSSSFRHQAAARTEFIVAIDTIWGAGAFLRFWFDTRRRLSMLVMRMMMRLRAAGEHTTAA